MKRIYLIAFLAVGILLSSCTIKDFEAPEFDKKISLPLMDERYYASDIADTTDDYIIAVNNDSMQFSITEDIETMTVEDELIVDAREDTFEVEVGDELEIEEQQVSTSIGIGDSLRINEQTKEFDATLDEIIVDPTGDAHATVDITEAISPGNYPSLPPMYDLPPLSAEFTPFENQNIEYAVIDSGYAYFTLTNNTEVPLSSTDSTHYMKLEIESGGYALIEYPVEGQLGPWESIEDSISLAGKTVHANNTLAVTLTTDGTDGPITIEEGDGVAVNFSTGRMKVSQASAKLPAEHIDYENELSLDEDIQPTSVVIESCEGGLFIRNDLPIGADITITFEELVDEEDDPFQLFIPLPANGTTTEGISFNDYRIQSETGEPLSSLPFSVNVETDPTDGYVDVGLGQGVEATITLGEMKFSEVSGYIHKEFVKSDTLSVEDSTITLYEAEIRNGNLYIDISGIDLEVGPDQSRLQLRVDEITDPSGDPLEMTLDQIPYNYELGDHTITLNEDQTLHYTAELELNQHFDKVMATDSVHAEVIFEDLIFDYVTGELESFTFEDTARIAVDETEEISVAYAKIDSCDVEMRIESELPIEADVNVIFHEIFDEDENKFEIAMHLPCDTAFSFAGYSIGHATDNAVLDSLSYSYAVSTEGTGGNTVTINYTDKVTATTSIGKMKFQEVRGIIHDKKIELEEIEEELDIEDLPENIEHMLDFQNVELVITINNGIDIGGQLYGRLTGYNDDTGEEAEVNIDEFIQPSDTTEIIIEEGVSELINIIPQRIVGDSLYVIIDGGDIVSITSEDSISGSFTLRTPFEFIINDKEGIRPDSVEHVEIDEDARETIGDHLNEVALNLIAENSFPFGSQIDVFFATEEDSVYDSPDYCVDSLMVTRPGPGQEASMNELVIELGRDAIEVFTNPDVYIGVELAVQGSDGETVILRPSDNIRLHGYLTVEGHISESLWED